MILRTAICDDNEKDIKMLEKLLEQYHFETGVEFDIKKYTVPDNLISDYTEPDVYDLIFLDVEIVHSDISEHGIEIAKKIRNIPDESVIIIFFSNYPKYMKLGYEVQAANYITKNTSFEQFKNDLDNIFARFQNSKSTLCIKVGRDNIQILRIEDIVYVKSNPYERKNVTYYMKNNLTFHEKRSILSVSEILKEYKFVMANQYYLVNLRFVNSLMNDTLKLDNGVEIQLSRHYKKDFMYYFSKNVLEI